jgi:hypothetical protein
MSDRDDRKDRDLAKQATSDLASPRRDAARPGRLGTFAALGAVAGGVPLPWLPDALQKRVRGALVHDAATRHGLSLSPDARGLLAEPAPVKDGDPGVMAHAVRYFARKILVRFGPLGMLPPVRAALETFVLGHLFERYLSQRSVPAVRIDRDEARRVRRAIDRAVFHLLQTEVAGAETGFDRPAEDLRDDMTQLVDGILIATAGAPSWLLRRLDASFDDSLAEVHG